MLPINTSPVGTMPSQMLSYKKKVKDNKKWAKECVDSLEALGRRQYIDNMRFAELYQVLNGQFIMHHYVQDEGYKDWMTLLTKEFEVPSTLRHYDIMEKVINHITEKLAEFPDIFMVREMFEEDDTNEYVRTQTRLMHESIKADINREIKEQLLAQGIDPDKQNFSSEEEAMQYHDELQKMAQAMTPPQIQKYMATDWKSQGEIWGNHQLHVDRETYNVTEMERKEMRDMLISDRCFRHYFLTGEGYMQETWNTINTFFHVSPDIDWAQDGDYVGRMFYYTKSDVISRYGWKMKTKDIERLESLDTEWEGKSDMSGFPYNVYAPFEDYKAYTQITQNMGYDPLSKIPMMNDANLLALTGRTPFMDRGSGLYRVTEVYWMSQQKIGHVIYIDEETGQLTKANVDENFIAPEGWKEVKGDFASGDEPNTVYWTYANQAWKGIKIAYSLADEDAIYLDLGPCEFQFKGDYSPFGAKLPVCGRIFNNRNAQSQSLAGKMLPHQVGHNVCMNQLYQLLEKEIGLFAVWDSAFFNTMKDWGGEDSWDKIALVAKELGHVFGDTSPQNMKGANPGNQLPKVVNMELTAQMMSRAKLADYFENKAMSQLGISPQMMSEVKATETAEGTQTAVTQSQLNVQKYYTDFFEYKKRCLSMSLDIAQYVQAKKKDIMIMSTKSDGSREFIRLTGSEILLRNMYVYVIDSQELYKQLQALKNYFVTNATASASALDVFEAIMAYSPEAIKSQLLVTEQKKEAKEQEAMQQHQQDLQQEGQIEAAKEEKVDARNDKDNQTKIQVATIAASAKGKSEASTKPANTGPTPLDYATFNHQVDNNQAKNTIQQDSNSIKRDKLNRDASLKAKELELKEKQLQERKLETKNKIRAAKITHKKPTK